PYQSQYQQPPRQAAPVRAGAYLAWSIVVTILCCWPLGIPAIVFAARINGLLDRGDIAGAQESARKSKIWTIVSACVGFVLGILIFVMAFVVGIAEAVGTF
ncbi:MAG: CD225/dispanin family protein, partial [Clostridia bacterium]|nr:CD225/dispanin family protein [Clostridia bacterium]